MPMSPPLKATPVNPPSAAEYGRVWAPTIGVAPLGTLSKGRVVVPLVVLVALTQSSVPSALRTSSPPCSFDFVLGNDFDQASARASISTTGSLKAVAVS